MEGQDQDAGLLTGIRILDLADEKASFCSKLLADLGAYVIKIERPGGDPSRNIGPFWNDSTGPERSLFFWYHNSNKRGITLDIAHDVGKDIFLRLVKKADVVVESFPPGYLKKLGLDYDVLAGKNPEVILVSVTGFGQFGPKSRYKTCDLVASAFGGQMYVSGSAETSPLKAFGEQSFYSASLFAAIGILLTLRKRKLSGRGAHLDISTQEAVISTLEHVLVRFFHDGVIPRRRGNIHWNHAFCILPCKDGHILLSPFHQWETLMEWMSNEGMAGDLQETRWLDQDYRIKHLDHIIAVISKWTRVHTRAELFELGQLMHLPWAPVLHPGELPDNLQLEAREYFRHMMHPEVGFPVKYPGPPYRFDPPFPNQCKRAPGMGEDNRAIYREEIGLSDEELERLASMNVM